MKRLGLLVLLLGGLAMPVFAQNLVMNGDFEGGNVPAPGGEIALGWEWWDGGIQNPIFPGSASFWNRPGTGNPGFGQRVIGGLINGQSFLGGIYQVVSGAIPGLPHILSFDYALAGTTDPGSGQERRIGYDLSGGTDPNSPSIVWVVVEDTTGDKPWQHFETAITPTGTTLTIWTRARIYWPIATTILDLDNVSLVPVPEPSGLAVLGVGLAWLWRRRRT